MLSENAIKSLVGGVFWLQRIDKDINRFLNGRFLKGMDTDSKIKIL